jgi:hypothetical protein
VEICGRRDVAEAVWEICERNRARVRQSRRRRAESRQLIERSRQRISASLSLITAYAERTGDDAPLVRSIARILVHRRGVKAVAWFDERAIRASGAGDRLSADIWSEIAEVAEDILLQGGLRPPANRGG